MTVATGVNTAAACLVSGSVAGDRAVRDGQSCGETKAQIHDTAAKAGIGRIAADGAVRHVERRRAGAKTAAKAVVQNAAAGVLRIRCRIASDRATVHGECGVIVPDASAGDVYAMRNRDPLNDHSVIWRDVEDAEARRVLRARDGEQLRTRTHDGDTPVDEKLGSCQRDALPIKRRIEINCVAVINDGERLTQ